MQRLERLFAINDTLRRAAPAKVSAATLAARYGVTRRTIERDIASLRAAGVPLYAERGRTGGQVSLDEIGNVVVSLTPGEVTALLVAVTSATPDTPFVDAADEAMHRLLDGLPPTTRVGVEELRSRIRAKVSEQNEAGAGVSKRVRRSAEAAVQRGVVLNLGYTDAAGKKTKRSVDPIGFYQGSDGWHLIGWCHLRHAGRIFRLDRIDSANLTKRRAAQHDVDEALGWTPNELRAP